MFDGHDQKVFELVAGRRLVELEQLELARDEHRATGRPLASVLLDLGLLGKPALFAAVADHLGADYLAEPPANLPAPVVALVDGNLARSYGVVPLRADEEAISLLAVNPFNQQLCTDLGFVLEREVRVTVADPDAVAALIRRHYGEDHASLDQLARELGIAVPNPGRELAVADLEELAGQTPIVRYVNLVLTQAIREHASDIHFEPFAQEFRIRCRVDGMLCELPPPPRALALPVISRLKVLAHLNIAERRLPQDGRIALTLAGRAVDLRISTLPTQHGESVVLRVLDQAARSLDLARLNLPASIETSLRVAIARPHGLVIVTGPTGSGKTTTLYGCLNAVHTPDVKILTVEDPVEYELDGVMQVQVNPAAGLTFGKALRAFLRQDPDIVMVGEMRDLETAQIAIQASLTGHLVLSTLHTNDAPGAVTRLLDLGAEPFLLASTLEAVLAQRLLRRVCPDCRLPATPPAAVVVQLGLGVTAGKPPQMFAGAGCPACQHTGYRGRIGIFELLPVNDELRDAITRGASLVELRRMASANGMTTLREAAVQALLAGETTWEEVARYT